MFFNEVYHDTGILIRLSTVLLPVPVVAVDAFRTKYVLVQKNSDPRRVGRSEGLKLFGGREGDTELDALCPVAKNKSKGERAEANPMFRLALTEDFPLLFVCQIIEFGCDGN